MRAVRFHQHGGLEVLKYEEAPQPKIQPNEVLVRVKACALNHLDIFLRQGVGAWKLPLPHIVGSDVLRRSGRGGRARPTGKIRGTRPALARHQLRPMRNVL